MPLPQNPPIRMEQTLVAWKRSAVSEIEACFVAQVSRIS
jgi:hypothetical protein